MPYRWPDDTAFTDLEFNVEEPWGQTCGGRLTVCDHRHRRLCTLHGPVHVVCPLVHCPHQGCPAHTRTISPEAETALALPWWVLGWDVVCWLGQRRFARHWSVAQLRAELADTYQIRVSDDAIERSLHRYQHMLAARQQDPQQLAAAYAGGDAVSLAIDGLQPEKGHETLYVVRELTQKRVWFAEALLSSATAEVQQLLARARRWAEHLGTPVRLWMSDKQHALVRGIAAEFPGVPHRDCANHFLRDTAKPVLEADSRAKVQMRRKVRGLRAIEREVLAEQRTAAPPEPASTASKAAACAIGSADEALPDVVQNYCAAVRGILNDDQGGPLQPPGLRMAEAFGDVQASLQRNLAAQKGGLRTNVWHVSATLLTGVWRPPTRREKLCDPMWPHCGRSKALWNRRVARGLSVRRSLRSYRGHCKRVTIRSATTWAASCRALGRGCSWDRRRGNSPKTISIWSAG